MVVTRRSSTPGKTAAHRGSTALILIGLFRLFKGLVLVAAGIVALKLLHKDIADVVTRWAELLRIDPADRVVQRTLDKLLSTTSRQLKEVSAGLFIYASLFLTEGVGLILQKRWAEYFTVITTSALIPLEVYELAKRVSTVKVAILAVNVVIVWYLISRIRAERGDPRRAR